MIARLVATSFIVAVLGFVDVAPARTEPREMAPQSYSRTTRDGWQLQIRLDNERVNAVPNLAAAANSREAFVTLSGTAAATGGVNPITDSLFVIGYQLGCQSDVSSGLQLGGSAGVAPSVSLGVVPTPTVGVGGSAGVSGFVQTVVQPGVIVNLPMGNMVLSRGGTGALDLDNVHVKADACGGDVTIRSFASLRASTETGHTEFAIYGDPIKI
ncbi:MspA family porin [Mycobacterium sp. CBMA271]|uniref:MspA family porin n=1 Tax=unclassified Mycobacteroides TaxID=2618759 RepID=UPI0013216521|nr:MULTISPECIES: MspA family porin [unclassified Mycobacteroides]MUM16628.1 MspA family protein [Mycobacteroides sp. CBMA 326]MUM22064.1 MspA family porin [Mycobacteroides sp. CBMA 271]